MASFSGEKDPNAVLDYQIDWSAWLPAGDTISTSTWTAEGLTVDSSTHTATTATVWLSGGAAGESAVVTNRIVTTAGRQDDRTLYIFVHER
jgi:hypothetical protein